MFLGGGTGFNDGFATGFPSGGLPDTKVCRSSLRAQWSIMGATKALSWHNPGKAGSHSIIYHPQTLPKAGVRLLSWLPIAMNSWTPQALMS